MRRTAKEGRDNRFWFDALPLQWIPERWSIAFSAYGAARRMRLQSEIQRVWRELVDTGEPILADGTVVVFQPPHRLVRTHRFA